MGANKLIGATDTFLSDCFLWIILGIFSRKVFKKFFKILFKKKLYYFVKVCFKNLPKNVTFKVFQIHLQVFFLFKSSGYKCFYITFEGPNVNEIISYFGHL
jgi:hypothetical protein